MVNITKNAAVELKRVLENGKKSIPGLRIFLAEMNCCGSEYGIGIAEKPQKTDEVYESHGIRIFVSKKVAKELNGSVIKYEETPYGSGFIIDSPTAFPSCTN
jgi:iron-sulfur cluster assembly protein